jgi:hypothetical protein
LAVTSLRMALIKSRAMTLPPIAPRYFLLFFLAA